MKRLSISLMEEFYLLDEYVSCGKSETFVLLSKFYILGVKVDVNSHHRLFPLYKNVFQEILLFYCTS